MNKQLRRLARLYKIELSYVDIWGNRHQTEDNTIVRLLSAMGVSAQNQNDITNALSHYEYSYWQQVAEPVMTVRSGAANFRVLLTLPEATCDVEYHWVFRQEDGTSQDGTFVPNTLHRVRSKKIQDRSFHRFRLEIPVAPPLGYHTLTVEPLHHCQHPRSQITIITIPETCYLPEEVLGDGQIWGVGIQLYSLRSNRNWGIGDFTDLKTLVDYSARAGASVIGLNPLHALPVTNPLSISPYSPSTRRAFHVLYLDVEAIDGFQDCQEARDFLACAETQEILKKLRTQDLVDYAAVSRLKLTTLRVLFEYFTRNHLQKQTKIAQGFREFISRSGEILEQYALFEALAQWCRDQDAHAWGYHLWPTRFQDPKTAAVSHFKKEHSEQLDFFYYLQWQVHLQLSQVTDYAKSKLRFGLYLDIALGSDRYGLDVWANNNVYARGMSMGAPPDELNLKGQDWGLPPLKPHALRELGYRPLREALRENMRYGAAVRLDHVMSLLRLFWVPQCVVDTLGIDATQGAYVRYPAQELMGVVALESQRNRCLVIGEDLGTVPNQIRALMDRTKIFSYKVLWFMKDSSGAFHQPEQYPPFSLATITTHDLPTVLGYWQERDIELRKELHLFLKPEMYDIQKGNRHHDKHRLIEALQHTGFLPKGTNTNEMNFELFIAMCRYMRKTSSKILIIQLEDIMEQADQMNLPGVTDEYPCWKYRISKAIEHLEQDPRWQRFVEAMRDRTANERE